MNILLNIMDAFTGGVMLVILLGAIAFIAATLPDVWRGR